MNTEDCIQEYNGVYDDKWHIVSPEGFDLPEGLEYIKNSWEGSWDKTYPEQTYGIPGKERIHKYNANIKISNVSLGSALKEILGILVEFHAYGTNFEIENCKGNTEELKKYDFSSVLCFANNLSIHGCQLTFKDLYWIMARIIFKEGNSYNLSDNVFINKDLTRLEGIKESLHYIREGNTPFKVFDLRRCNFSKSEKESLIKEAGNLNFLI